MKVNFKIALIASVIMLVSLSLIISNYMSYNNLKDVAINDIKSGLQNRVEREAETLENYLNGKIVAVDRVADFYEEFFTIDGGEDIKRLEIASRAMNLSFVMVGYDDGRAYASGDTWEEGIAPSSYVTSQRPWYEQANNNPKPSLSNIYQDATTNKYVVSAMKDFGDGIILADIPLNFLDKSTANIKSDIAYAVVMTEEGIILSTTSKNVKTGESIKNHPTLSLLYQNAIKQHDGFIEYELNGEKKLAFTRKIYLDNSKSLYLITGMTRDDLFADVDIVARNSIITTLIMIAISALIMILVLRVVYKPVVALRDMLNKISNGDADLTQRLIVVNENDDLGKICNYINHWISDNQNTMIQIKSVSDNLGNVVNSIRSNSLNNIEILNEHVAQTEQVVTAIEEMNVTARSVAESASQASEVTQKANQTGEKSRYIVDEAQQSVISLVSDVEKAASGVKRMSEETQNISTITDVIGGIAEQTNLLALNAAIEAARAGEQGRGFAVVADEVRQLASRTQTSTSEIDTALGGLTDSSENIVKSMDNTRISVEHAAEQTSAVGSSLSLLSDAITEINDITGQIATAAEEQTSVSVEISKNMTEISHMANTVNENVCKTAENVESMADMYDQLNKIVGNSKIQ